LNEELVDASEEHRERLRLNAIFKRGHQIESSLDQHLIGLAVLRILLITTAALLVKLAGQFVGKSVLDGAADQIDVYSYDPIGHCEKATYRAGGTAGTLLQPVLDNQIGHKNMNLAAGEVPKLDKERAVSVASDTFISAAERDIYTGDSVLINIITKDGIEVRQLTLRQD